MNDTPTPPELGSATPVNDVEQWGLFERSFECHAAGNPYQDVELSARFTQEERTVAVDGFYDGDGTFRVRFMPDRQGAWHYRTASTLAELDGQEGTFTVVAPGDTNHGPVRVVDALHFAYADGTPYHPVGTTCYVWNLQGDELEERTLHTLADAPFNKMRMCVFPKYYVFNHNEPPSYPFPGEPRRDREPTLSFGSPSDPVPDYWDFSQFNPEYFQRLERRIMDLQQLGIEADLILFHPYDSGAWGFDRMPAEVNTRYLRYIVARLAALRNVWWSFANEYDLLFDKTVDDWDSYLQLVQERDPYGHLRSIHNLLDFYDHGKPWVTHCSVQHADFAQVTTWQRRYGKPVVIDECGYEGDIDQPWGNLPPQELVHRFWLGFAEGAYVGHGETYLNAEEVLWWSKGGELRGESVPRIAFLRSIIEEVPGAGLAPLHPLKLTMFETVQDFLSAMASARAEAPTPDVGVGGHQVAAAGHSGNDYFLLYSGTHQPAFQEFSLPEGAFRIDVIDTWDMTITCWSDNVTGNVRVDLPARPRQALRIVRSAGA